ncbi:hypothetical protein BDB01DRAFT_855156 [Pilobolus umbonatus]|nr:hypothetical protein BDB01DRAFT_855156 [Pilobolus umbonatus]
MSVYSTDSGEFTFANRTSTAQFQERLLEAQQLSRNEELEEQLNLNDLSFNNDPEDLKNKLEALKKQVARMEDQVVKYEEQLIKRREKRKLETSLTNMTPEERANYMENEVDEKELPHMDVIFEYLLLVGTATSSNANDLSNTDLLKPSAAIREKAMHDENVLKQTQYSKIRFTEAHNLLEPNPDEPGEIRHCQLKGEVYHERFSITFDVLEPALIMSNIQYDINIEMQLEIGVVLQRIKETSNIMAFFQSLVHYARLTHQRSETFNYMVELYREKEVDVELISESSIEFIDGMKNATYSHQTIMEYKGRLSKV